MNKELKTCIVTGQYPPQVGGVGHSAHRVANLLADHGLNTHVVAFEKHPNPLPFDESLSTAQEGNTLVHRAKVFHPSGRNGSETSGSENTGAENTVFGAEVLTRYNREMFDALQHFQREHRYDVLHAFFLYPGGYIAGSVARLNSIKMIASIRGNDVAKYAFDPLRAPFVCSALSNADYVTSVSTHLLEMADRALVPVAGHSRTILNSVDTRRLRARVRPELDLKGTVIGTSGLFRYKKGLVYLLKALSRLKHRFQFTLLLLGDFMHAVEREPFLRELKRYDLSDRTVITGKVPHDTVPDYLQLFDILVFPSLFSEGCPLSMLEAMAMKKPVIGSRAGAIPEVICDHKNGLLVNPGFSEEIEEALTTLIQDPGLRNRLAEAAAATIREMSCQRELDDWLDVYEQVFS